MLPPMYAGGVRQPIWPDSSRSELAPFGQAIPSPEPVRYVRALQSISEPVRVITAGVDVQRDRIDITFLGFSEAESFVLGHSVVWGDPKESVTWAEVDDALKTTWCHPLGRTLGLDAAAVDAGDGETMDAVQR